MNNRKPRRSSILKPPKQVARAPFQDLDSDDDENVTQPTNRRVSFSRTSQIKEFDPSIGYMANWHQSYEESLESLEGDENQAKSANVFDGLASVQMQKKFKRKRTSTVQLSLTTNNDETNGGACSNPSILQNSGARANKQPRKSLDCFQTELVEEGDTSMFFDELNLTEPIKSSYSNIDASTDLTMTLMDSSFNLSDVDICRSKTDLPTGHSSKSSSKFFGGDTLKLTHKVTCISGDTIDDILPKKDCIVIHADQNAPCDAAVKYGPMDTNVDSMTMDCTLVPGKIEIVESFIDIETLGNQRHSSSKERNCNENLSKDNNENKFIGSRDPSIFEKDKNNIKDLLPSLCLSKKDLQYRDSKENFDGNSSLEASMELTIPQIQLDAALPNTDYSGRNTLLNKSVKVNGEETGDLDMTSTWGQIVEQKNSVLPTEDVNLCGVATDKPKSLMDILNTNGDCTQECVVDSTVSSDMELSMTAGGIAIQENFENGCGNSTQGNDTSEESCAAVEGMELTVPLGKLNMSKARDNSENIDPQQPFENSDVLKCDQIVTVTEKNWEDLPKVMTEQSCVLDAVNNTSFSSGLYETCGMEMTIPLGKIRGGKMPKDTDENVVDVENCVKDGYSFKELGNDRKPDEILREGQKTIRETNVEHQSSSTWHHSHEVLIGSQIVKETTLEAILMRETVELKLQQPHEEHDENVENLDSCSLIGNKTNLVGVGMDMTTSLERQKDKCGNSVHSPMPNHLNGNNTNPDVMGMELTVPLGKLRKEKMLNVSCAAVSSSHIEDVVSPETAGIEMTHPSQNMRVENCEDTVGNMMTESYDPNALDMELTAALGKLKGMKSAGPPEPLEDSQSIDDANPDTMGMELTVPLGRLSQEKHNYSDDNVLPGSQVMDETIPDAMGMELTVPLGRLMGDRCKDPISNVLPQNQTVNSTTAKMSGMELTIPQGRMKGGKNEEHTENVLRTSQIVNDTNPELMGMELTVPFGKIKQANGNKCISSLLPPTHSVDETNPEVIAPLERMTEVEGAQVVEETLVESKLLDGADLKAKIVDSSVTELELKVENVNLTENFIEENQLIDLMTMDDDGMEMTVPVGGLKRVKSVGTGEAHSLEPEVLDETNSKEGSAAPLVKLEIQKNPCSGIDSEGETHDNELSIKEVGMSKSEIEGVHFAAQYSQVINSANAEILEKQPLVPSDGQENRDPDGDSSAGLIPEDNIKKEGESVESRVCLSGTENEQEDENRIVDKLPVCKAEVETQSVDTLHESKIGFAPCSEKMNQPVEIEAAVLQEEEEIIPEQEAMEQSLSEVVGDKPQAVCRANMEFQAVSETSFGGCELMETCNTPTKKSESPKVRSPVQDVAALEPLDSRLVSSPVNCQRVESDMDPAMSSKRYEHQLENRMGKRKSVDIEKSVICPELPPAVRRESKGKITFDEPAQKESDETEMDFTVALGKLKLLKEENKIVDDMPPLINSSIDARHGAHKSRGDDKDSSIIDHNPCAIDLEVVPSVNSGFAPFCGNNQQPLKDPSFSLVNRIGVSSVEVPMECVSFSGKDSRVEGGDCVEPMEDMCVQDDVEPCGIKSNGEIKSVRPSEVDFGPMEESNECQMADEVSDLVLSSANQEPCNSISTADMTAANPGKCPEPMVSIEDWIRYESSKESCDWAVHKILENQFSIMVFHEAAVLIINLVPSRDSQDSKDKRAVESVLLKSCISDESDWCCKVVLNTMLKRLSPSFLSSKCSSTEQLPNLFEFLNTEFEAMNVLLKQSYDIQRVCPVDEKCDGFSFMVPSMKRMLLFEVKITLLNWDSNGIKPEDVLVKNAVGKMGLTEIQSIVQSVKCDEHYLRNIYKEVLNFIYTLEEVLE